jgi:LacI family repressor for deo operon, udp, cdd, tsx, nupC, and nupG
VVFVEKPLIDSKKFNYIAVDIADGVSQSVEYLFNKGRRHIAMLISDSQYPAFKERRKGYAEICRKLNMPVTEDLIYLMDDHLIVSPEMVYAAVKELITRHKVDSILAQNDIYATYVIKSCRSLGCKVPDDIAVVGFDNLNIASLFEPTITTIDLNPQELPCRVVEMAVNLIEGKELPLSSRQIVLNPKLIARESA